MNKLLQYYQIFCNLSLDVVLGVACCMIPLPDIMNVEMPFIWYWVLPLCTWLIYLTDHVIDVTRLKTEYPSPRHRFIRKHKKAIIVFIVLTSASAAWQVLHHVNKELFFAGLILFLLVLIHFTIVKINPDKRSWINNKEFAVSFIYASGIYAGPMIESYSTHGFQFTQLLLFVLFFGITFLNLLMSSIIEHDWDVEMKNASFVRVIGLTTSIKIFNLLVVFMPLIIVTSLNFLNRNEKILAIIYLLIIAGHIFIYIRKQSLEKCLLHRKLSEALFWLPAVAIIFW